MKPPVRTSANLREMLFNQMEKVQDGTADPQMSAAMCRLSSEIVRTVRLELEYARDLRSAGDTAALVAPIALGVPEDAPVVQRISQQERPVAVPAKRHCLRCKKIFDSESIGNRICLECAPKNNREDVPLEA